MAGCGHVHNRITTVGDSCTSSSLGVYSPDTKGEARERESPSPECILQLDRARQSDARMGSLLRTYTKYDGRKKQENDSVALKSG